MQGYWNTQNALLTFCGTAPTRSSAEHINGNICIDRRQAGRLYSRPEFKRSIQEQQSYVSAESDQVKSIMNLNEADISYLKYNTRNMQVQWER